jgi:hypothetical protein
MTDEDRKQLAILFIAALRAVNANGFRAIMTDDVVWTLPGTSVVSGIAKRRGRNSDARPHDRGPRCKC